MTSTATESETFKASGWRRCRRSQECGEDDERRWHVRDESVCRYDHESREMEVLRKGMGDEDGDEGNKLKRSGIYTFAGFSQRRTSPTSVAPLSLAHMYRRSRELPSEVKISRTRMFRTTGQGIRGKLTCRNANLRTDRPTIHRRTVQIPSLREHRPSSESRAINTE